MKKKNTDKQYIENLILYRLGKIDKLDLLKKKPLTEKQPIQKRNEKPISIPIPRQRKNVIDRKEYIKQYSIDNKERIQERMKIYSKQYYQKVKDKRQEKNNCLCGGKYVTSHISKHIQSLRHIRYFNEASHCPISIIPARDNTAPNISSCLSVSPNNTIPEAPSNTVE
jgi:hypothetical protein